MKKFIYLLMCLSIYLSNGTAEAQSASLHEAYEKGFNDGYNFGKANNSKYYQKTLTLINSYTVGGIHGGPEYLAAYRNGLRQGWTLGYQAYLQDKNTSNQNQCLTSGDCGLSDVFRDIKPTDQNKKDK
ncbi:hypothetical protein [uncultured Tenacibaculum sp.]|uniref:hypothetical protein n=1 Tax=uncultured Tenacibaculum sp. TaxID=174713 RepID=UPI002630BC54|nr:hypothetical protein [uncultured Tenacibaculum sp.]